MDIFRFVIYLGIIPLLAFCSGNATQQLEIRSPDETKAEISSTKTTFYPETNTRITASPGPIIITTTQPPTSTPTPKTPTALPETWFVSNCIKTVSPSPTQLKSEGIVILSSIVPYTFETLRLDLKTGEKTLLAEPNQSTSNFAVSPNKELLAYRQSTFNRTSGKFTNPSLIISNAEGQPEVSIPWSDQWYQIYRWLDNDRLDIPLLGEEPLPHLILNPFNGEQQLLKQRFKDYFDLYPIPSWEGSGGSVYASSLAHVIYPRVGRTSYEYALEDTQTQKSVSVLPSFDIYHYPYWSPDGSQYAAAANLDPVSLYTFEFFSANLDGQISQLSHLTDYFEKIDIHNWSWSPNGRSIAFWMVPNPDVEKEETLAVLDIATQKVTNYCITSGSSEYTSRSPAPLWSPNGKQLIIENRIQQDSNSVILIDLGHNLATQIAENMEPVAWIVGLRETP